MSDQAPRASGPKKTDQKGLAPEFKAQAGRGRPKGVPNKSTTAVKDMVIAALGEAGGIQYLVTQAALNPSAFMTLVGKVIPLQVAGSADDGAIVHRIELVGVAPK